MAGVNDAPEEIYHPPLLLDHPTTIPTIRLSQNFPIQVRSCTSDSDGIHVQFQELTLRFSKTDAGRNAVFADSIIRRKALDPLRKALREALSEGAPLSDFSTFNFAVTVLRLAEIAAIHIYWPSQITDAPVPKPIEPKKRAFKRDKLKAEASTMPNDSASKQVDSACNGWNTNTITDWSAVLDNDYGLNLSTVENTAQHLLGGRTLEAILADVPPWLRILHAEPIFRDDLVYRFMKKQDELKISLKALGMANMRSAIPLSALRGKTFPHTDEGFAEYLSRPKVAFHGAPRSVVPSIVRYGFIIPGQKLGQGGTNLEIRCGASFGVGIYSSPDLEYAEMYTTYDLGGGECTSPRDIPGSRILICAVLMGMPYQVSRARARRKDGLLNPNAHSHVSTNELEYIVFDSAQIIPCYVLHCDYGAAEARYDYEQLTNDKSHFLRKAAKAPRADTTFDEDDALFPAAIKAKKAAMKAAAMKWFPYGFGAATGTNFVIEEIGEISDDEEDFGDYQVDRGNHGPGSEQTKYCGGGNWFDEYQTVRTTGKKVW